jgi:transcriptional regulator with XRE-family HTH domain
MKAGQSEFTDIFWRLEYDFKMTKAAVARALRIERSYVTMLINGKRAPSIRTLEAMRKLEIDLKAGCDKNDAAEGDNELNRLIRQLKTLKETDPPTFQVAKQVVDSLAQTSSQSPTACCCANRAAYQ